MSWNDRFGKENMPTNEELLQFLGEAKLRWSTLVETIETTDHVMPR